MACASSFTCQPVRCSIERRSISHNLNLFKTSISSMVFVMIIIFIFNRLRYIRFTDSYICCVIWINEHRAFQPIHRVPLLAADAVSRTIKETSVRILDAFVDAVFKFSDQPLLPSQRNFAPVDEMKEPAFLIGCTEGEIPDGFTEGIYIRNGPNPIFGGYKSTVSVFGRSSHTWVEGEGMLHAIYFVKNSHGIKWNVVYNNKYVGTETYKLEIQRDRPSFLPAIEGDSLAILSSYLLNFLRFGKVNKYFSNTNVFEHSGKLYSISENHMPQEIDLSTLETLGNWDVNGAWNRAFTAHPKKVPGTGELVILGIDAVKPFLEVGVISADGKLVHKVDLKLDRSCLCHEMGVTERYNVVMDMALTIDLQRLIGGGPLMKYDKGGYARIAVLPRYGDENSIKWFEVEPNCTFHVLNCFEDGDEVVMWGCRALASIIPGPDLGLNKFEWFSNGFKPVKSVKEYGKESTEDGPFFCRPHEWRLNMKTGKVKERDLVGSEFSMEFPMINGAFTGIKNKYGYTQVVDSVACATSGMSKYGGLAKLYFADKIKVEYHMLPENTFCSGAAFVPKAHGQEEDDGWIITYVHNEVTEISQVYIVDAKNFSSEPVAKITLPGRVPYGFHGAFIKNEPNH